MKILHLSDTHGQHRDIDQEQLLKADVIVHSGDVCHMGDDDQAKDFLKWFDDLDYPHKILVPGNHDFYFENEYFWMPDDINILIGESEKIDGIVFWGSPFTEQIEPWAFQTFRHEQETLYKSIPDDTDIVITHGPAYGQLDLDGSNFRTGDAFLRTRLEQLGSLKAHLHGHIHSQYGSKQSGTYTTFNSALCDSKYCLANRPQLIDLQNIK